METEQWEAGMGSWAICILALDGRLEMCTMTRALHVFLVLPDAFGPFAHSIQLFVSLTFLQEALC